ncbi:hypothetical protein F4821DRAFT_246070 [Hypoxylon rubiginosum]|uniref:Uncharacterized protein n=1 Tax=Hypoxylon rubiginosum TaxID=110542 RepID=A0ACC0CR03_9PEZI|nr:hypothetical protein F4821DRAFT_246070 [Hypoxylon rubiginosum]
MGRYIHSNTQTPQLKDDANMLPLTATTHQQMVGCFIVPFPKSFSKFPPRRNVGMSSDTSRSSRTDQLAGCSGDNVSSNDDPPLIDPSSDTSTRLCSDRTLTASQPYHHWNDWEYEWVMHGLNCHDLDHPDMEWEILDESHNRQIHPMYWIPAELLLVRFAWSLFSNITFTLFRDEFIYLWNIRLRVEPMDQTNSATQVVQLQRNKLPQQRTGREKKGSTPFPPSNTVRVTAFENETLQDRGLYGYSDSSDQDEDEDDDVNGGHSLPTGNDTGSHCYSNIATHDSNPLNRYAITESNLNDGQAIVDGDGDH